MFISRCTVAELHHVLCCTPFSFSPCPVLLPPHSREEELILRHSTTHHLTSHISHHPLLLPLSAGQPDSDKHGQLSVPPGTDISLTVSLSSTSSVLTLLHYSILSCLANLNLNANIWLRFSIKKSKPREQKLASFLQFTVP